MEKDIIRRINSPCWLAVGQCLMLYDGVWCILTHVQLYHTFRYRLQSSNRYTGMLQTHRQTHDNSIYYTSTRVGQKVLSLTTFR